MHWNLRMIFLGVGLTVLYAPACAWKRQEVMTCGFSDGSRVELRATYEWSPLGAVLRHIGDVSSRSEQSAYAVYVKDEKGKWQASPRWVSWYGRPLDGKEVHMLSGTATCLSVGRLNGRFLVDGSFKQDNGKWFLDPAFDLKLNSSVKAMPVWVAQHLKKIQGTPTESQFSFMAPMDGAWVNEQPISNKNAHFVIHAVYQSISKDEGQTWSAPIITPHARIFEIGRKLEEQSFVGRPLDFEGHAFPKPEFPAPQTAEERQRTIESLPAEWREVVSGPDPKPIVLKKP